MATVDELIRVTVGLDEVVELNPVDGLHEYEWPAVAEDPMPPEVPPLQIVCGVTTGVGNGLTVTLTELVLTHPADVVSVSEYVVLTLGHAVGLDTVAELNPVDGVHA